MNFHYRLTIGYHEHWLTIVRTLKFLLSPSPTLNAMNKRINFKVQNWSNFMCEKVTFSQIRSHYYVLLCEDLAILLAVGKSMSATTETHYHLANIFSYLKFQQDHILFPFNLLHILLIPFIIHSLQDSL